MRPSRIRALSACRLLFVFGVMVTTPLYGTIQVTLASSPMSPQPVGTTVTWTASISDNVAGSHELQFSVGPSGGPSAIVRDYHPSSTFTWTPTTSEGSYTISVVVRNLSTQGTGSASASFTVTSRLVNGRAAVSATNNPLVALFSAPACQVPNQMRIRFTPQTAVPPGGLTASMVTNLVPCRYNTTSPNPDATSMNFYIAGMYPNTGYHMHYEVVATSVLRTGADLSFTTGSLPGGITFPTTQVLVPPHPPSSVSAPILLHDYLPQGDGRVIVPTATDLSGNILWYYSTPVSLLTRTEPGGNFFIIDAGNTNPYYQLVREIDLCGNTVRETNVARINEQLLPLGRLKINAFHHEARRLPGGYIAVLGSDEKLVTNAQGGTQQNPVDVLAAQVLVLDQNLQLTWAWDGFDFLDINRVAPLDEICHHGQIGCPVFFLASQANDWLHANSIQQTPDGNLLVSLRHQDWLIKIAYGNGTGDGHVIWRMGYQGDFTMLNPPTSSLCTTPDQQDAYQWFTHQHDANFQPQDPTVLSVFDNGNLRRAKCDTNGNSRGYVLNIDETNRNATLLLGADLGNYSLGLGTAELIPGSSNYHFELGWIFPGKNSTSMEVDPAGIDQYALQELNITTYRSYRMQDLYTPALQ